MHAATWDDEPTRVDLEARAPMPEVAVYVAGQQSRRAREEIRAALRAASHRTLSILARL